MASTSPTEARLYRDLHTATALLDAVQAEVPAWLVTVTY